MYLQATIAGRSAFLLSDIIERQVAVSSISVHDMVR
jgi:hypothetical protein